MKYLFILYSDEDDWETMGDAKRSDIYGAYMAYTDALKNAGVHISGAPLSHSREAKRIRANGVQDGPFADGKEQLGGFYMVDVKDLDEALEWAARCPCASMGHVEVRPIWNIGN